MAQVVTQSEDESSCLGNVLRCDVSKRTGTSTRPDFEVNIAQKNEISAFRDAMQCIL
jgi:hypothetical protein